MVRNTSNLLFSWITDFSMMISASCRRLLNRNGVCYSHLRLQGAAPAARLFQILSGWPAKRSLCASVLRNKLNQPKLHVKEESEHLSDLTHPQPRPPGVIPGPPGNAQIREDSKSRSHDHAAASTNTVDGVFQEQHQNAPWMEKTSKKVEHREEQRQEEEEWTHAELTWRKLPSIYLKLSKSRLTGIHVHCRLFNFYYFPCIVCVHCTVRTFPSVLTL